MPQNDEPPWFFMDFKNTLAYYAQQMADALEKGGEKATNDIMRYLAERDLFFLLVFVIGRKDLIHPWLFDRCREVQREPDGRLDLWARFHYKSTIITYGMTIFDIINDQNISIGIFSHTKGVAKKFLKGIKETFEQNKMLPKLWPDVFYENPKKQAPKWSEDDGITVKRTSPSPPKECTIEAHGLVDGQPTGRHFQLLIYDDVVTIESVNTPDQISKTTYCFRMSSNLGTPKGKARYIGTRYHMFDTYHAMIDDKIAVPRIRTVTDNGREDGNPVLLTYEQLAKVRKTLGVYVFASQMLLNPTADAAMGFRREWLVFADTEESAAMRMLWRFIIVDPAGGKQRKGNDYTTMLVIGFGLDGKYRVLEIIRDRLKLSDRASTLIALHQKWKPGLVAYEEYGMQADIEHIKYVQSQTLYEFDIVPLGGPMPKELRILRLIPYFENGYRATEAGGDGMAKSRIILPTTMNKMDYQNQMRDLVKDFVEQEYVAFPVLAHDDMLDCMARIADLEAMGLIRTPSVMPTAPTDLGVASGFRKTSKQQGSGSWYTG